MDHHYTNGGSYNETLHEHSTSSSKYKIPSPLEMLKYPFILLRIVAMVTNLALLILLIVRIYRHVKKKETNMAQWPRFHVLCALCVAHEYYLIISLLFRIRVLSLNAEWVQFSEARCIIMLTLMTNGPVIGFVYLAILGSLTCFQVFSPSTLIGKRQFKFWLSVLPAIWILSFALMAIRSKHAISWGNYKWYGRLGCYIDSVEIFVLSDIILISVPLLWLILFAFVSVVGIVSASSFTPRSATGDNRMLQWTNRSRKKAVVFVTILAVLALVILLPHYVLFSLYSIYASRGYYNEGMLGVMRVWQNCEICLYVFFPIICLALDELGAYPVFLRVKIFLCSRTRGTAENATYTIDHTQNTSLEPTEVKAEGTQV